MFEERSRDRYLPIFRTASGDLDRILFPILIRPNIPADSPVTPDLLNWSIRMYCFSLLSHLRELLHGFVILAETPNIPAAYIVARCLFETGAHTYYVHKHLAQYMKAGDPQSAWDLMHEVNMGSLYMREEYAEIAGESGEQQLPKPREIAKVIRCFDEFGNIGKAARTYSFLSEFSHPNMAAFSHYYEMTRGEEGVPCVKFTDAPQSPLAAPLPEVSISIVVGLHFVGKLLHGTGETDVAPQIQRILIEFDTDSSSAGKATGDTSPLAAE